MSPGGSACSPVTPSTTTGKRWKCLVSKKNRKTMLATLDLLAEVDFDVLLANTGATNPVCCVEVDEAGRSEFIAALRAT